MTGSIPARAGEPVTYRCNGLSPRVRGNRNLRFVSGVTPWGLSPRVRGNRQAVASRASSRRAAGLSPRVRGNHKDPTVHSLQRHAKTGLSPRVRGNLRLSLDAPPGCGSIPARAGEPIVLSYDVARCGSIPARAGEPSYQSNPWVSAMLPGLSPRVRGNRLGLGEPFVNEVYPRACGGTLSSQRLPCCMTVYPRACGGTSMPLALHG